jgi:LmbE family N-acetylglucosaminyl deacetylase
VGVVRRLRPDVVLCPDPTAVFFGQDYFNHRDHRATGWATLDAVSPAAALPHYVPEAGPAHQVSAVLLSGTLEPDVWVDVSATLATKEAAVTCHRSQFSDDGEWARTAVRLGAEEAGRRCGRAFAEGFRRLRLGG